MGTSPLDIEQPDALRAYLVQRGHVRTDAAMTLENLAGGVSNRTVRVTFADGSGWVLKQALAKLRVKVDWFADPARVDREAMGIRALSELAPGRVPGLVFHDPTHHLLAMHAVPQPHENWKSVLLAGRGTPEQAAAFGELLASLHTRARERATEFEPLFRDRRFFETLRLEPYYAYAATQCPAAQPFIAELLQDTRGRLMTLVHGDYSPKNILVHQGQLILLDHEVIHWGDPAFDVGFALTHLLSKAHHLREQRDRLLTLARAFWRGYGDVSQEAMAVRHTLGCLLARVRGRSTLEYLSSSESEAQARVTLALMLQPPRTVTDLIHHFIERIDHA